MLFSVGAGVGGEAGGDGAAAVVVAVVVVVVLGVVVVDGLFDLFPAQPAVMPPRATMMTAPAITRVCRAVGDAVTIGSSLLPMTAGSTDTTVLAAANAMGRFQQECADRPRPRNSNNRSVLAANARQTLPTANGPSGGLSASHG